MYLDLLSSKGDSNIVQTMFFFILPFATIFRFSCSYRAGATRAVYDSEITPNELWTTGAY